MSSDEQPIVLFSWESSLRRVWTDDGSIQGRRLESGNRYSVSEWKVAPHSPGSGPHSHESNEELFVITEAGSVLEEVKGFPRR